MTSPYCGWILESSSTPGFSRSPYRLVSMRRSGLREEQQRSSVAGEPRPLAPLRRMSCAWVIWKSLADQRMQPAVTTAETSIPPWKSVPVAATRVSMLARVIAAVRSLRLLKATPVLAGITSVGFECARVGYPGIYTRVTTFLSWMQEYLPLAASLPLAPQDVQVTAIAGERLLVEWRAPLMSSAPVTGYQAVAEPGGESCAVGPTELACVIEGVPAGRVYTVTTSVVGADGGQVFADSVQAVSVDGVTSTGVRVRPRRLVEWAGLRARSVDDIKLAVRPASREVCSRLGKSSKSARGTRSKEWVVCSARHRRPAEWRHSPLDRVRTSQDLGLARQCVLLHRERPRAVL